MKTIILVLLPMLFMQCGNSQSTNISNQKEEIILSSSTTKDSTIIKEKEEEYHPLIVENRTKILEQLQLKTTTNIPLIVHLYVPLCDNENQGIVPTSESLGNGLDLKRNLYWATSKGVKRYYKELPDWKFISSQKDIDGNVLERVVFTKNYNNKTTVYLIADAYRGDRMKVCLENFFNALSGNRLDSTVINGDMIHIGKDADLSIFNGHNGLMDDTPSILPPKPHSPKDAVAIACVSGEYFKGYYEYVSAFPLVNTNHLLYPGAFISEGIINEWALLKSAKDCKIAAGKSYYKNKPKSGPNGSQNLFNYGWRF